MQSETEYPPCGGYVGDFHIYEPHIYTKCVALTKKVYHHTDLLQEDRCGGIPLCAYFVTLIVPFWIS
jgi:hypothetical protein